MKNTFFKTVSRYSLITAISLGTVTFSTGCDCLGLCSEDSSNTQENAEVSTEVPEEQTNTEVAEENKNLKVLMSISAQFEDTAEDYLENELNSSKELQSVNSIYAGTIQFKEVNSGDIVEENLNLILDSDTGLISTAQSFTLDKGDYTVTAQVKHSEKKREFIAKNVVVISESDDDQNISLQFKPVVANSDFTFQDINNTAMLKFSYPTAELSQFVDPKLVVKIDGLATQTYSFNNSGMTDVYLALQDGNYNAVIQLQDNCGLKGQFKGQLNIIAGQDLTVNIEPINAVVSFDPVTVDDTLKLKFTLPDTLFSEVSESYIRGTILYNSTNYDLTISNRVASVTLDNVNSESIAFSATFTDANDDDFKVADFSVEELNLNDINSTSVTETLNIYRRTTASGNLLASLGVNILDEESVPVKDAKIYINSSYKGLSGENPSYAGGFFETDLIAKSYTVTAFKDLQSGSATVDLSDKALQSENIEIKLTNNDELSSSELRNYLASLPYRESVSSWYSWGSGDYELAQGYWHNRLQINGSTQYLYSPNSEWKTSSYGDYRFIRGSSYSILVMKNFTGNAIKLWGSRYRNNQNKYTTTITDDSGDHYYISGSRRYGYLSYSGKGSINHMIVTPQGVSFTQNSNNDNSYYDEVSNIPTGSKVAIIYFAGQDTNNGYYYNNTYMQNIAQKAVDLLGKI